MTPFLKANFFKVASNYTSEFHDKWLTTTKVIAQIQKNHFKLISAFLVWFYQFFFHFYFCKSTLTCGYQILLFMEETQFRRFSNLWFWSFQYTHQWNSFLLGTRFHCLMKIPTYTKALLIKAPIKAWIFIRNLLYH